MLFLITIRPMLVINCHNFLTKNLLNNSTQRLVVICCQSKLLSAMIANKSLYATKAKVTPFESMVEKEKKLAKNYVLVEDSTHTIANMDNNYFSELFNSDVNNVWKYTYAKKNCALIDLKSSEKFFDNSMNSFVYDSCVFPVKSRMMVFRPKSGDIKTNLRTADKIANLMHRRKDQIIDFNASEMKHFYESNEKLLKFLLDEKYLTELDIKLRFFIVNQLEELLCGGYFNAFKLLPFGSSLSGLGNSSSDLDLVLKYIADQSKTRSQLTYAYKDSERDLSETQRIVEIAGDLIQHLTPNFSRVQKVLRARIPIIKFHFDLAPIDIDLSAEVSNAHHGVIMAEYLSYCNSLNSSVRKLILLIRFWAKQHGLTRSQPGHTFTNFQLTSLVLHYFQTLNTVPPMAAFIDKKPLDFVLDNTVEFDIIDLLHDFLIFVLQFNYRKNGISLVNAKTIPKPNFSALYIENPCERELNVCQNVSAQEFEKFIVKATIAYEIMENQPFILADVFNNDIQRGKCTVHRALKAHTLFDEN